MRKYLLCSPTYLPFSCSSFLCAGPHLHLIPFSFLTERLKCCRKRHGATWSACSCSSEEPQSPCRHQVRWTLLKQAVESQLQRLFTHTHGLETLAKVWDGVLGSRPPSGSPVRPLLGLLVLEQPWAETELRFQ